MMATWWQHGGIMVATWWQNGGNTVQRGGNMVQHGGSMVTDMSNIAIANEYKVAYGLSIDIFTFDFGPF